VRITLIALYDAYSYGIRTIAAGLRQGGHDVTCIFFKTSAYIDSVWTEKEIDSIVREAEGSAPELIAIGLRSPLRLLGIELCRELKYNMPTIPIIIGGHHPTIMPEDCLTFADGACVGEGDYAMLELANKGFDKISEIDSFYPNPMRNLNQDLDSIPFPWYEHEDNIYLDSSIDYNAIDAPVGLMLMSARGCFFSCSFCFNESIKPLCKNLGRYVRRRSVDNVLKELHIIKLFFPNLKSLPFADNVFTFGDKWIDEFCEKIKDYDIQFRCFSHFNMIKQPMLEKLVDAGLNCVTVGFQHGSQKLRKDIFNRYETNNEIIEGSYVLANLGITVRYDLITNIAYSTLDDAVEEDKLLMAMIKPYTIRRFPLRYYPQTSLTKRLLADNLIQQTDIEGWKIPFFKDEIGMTYTTYEDTK
jgi:anaerobic magnesium-protoporphyrin IX monomethyl ester cyclase